MAILFISNVVPDSAEFHNAAFTRSGNNVVLGIANSLSETEDVTLITCRPIPSFPHGPLWISGEETMLDSGRKVKILPMVNMTVLKNLFWGISIYREVKKWAKEHANEDRRVLVYNIYTPPISFLYRVCKKTSSKLFAILYDFGVPPKRLGLGWLRMKGYEAMEKVAKKYIPLLDGRIVINENIVNYYAPGRDYILVDGGVNKQVIDKLFPLLPSRSGNLVFVLAGMLWDQNGTKLVLNTLEKYPDLDIDIYFAGKGNDVELIEQKAKNDSRIHYVGMLNMEQLFRLYEKADVLLNLRIEEKIDFHFPSKLLEYLATGKHVLSTPVAHAERDYGEYMTVLTDITPDGLASSINSIISIGKMEIFEKGRKARKYILDKRNWKTRTDEIVEYMNSKLL